MTLRRARTRPSPTRSRRSWKVDCPGSPGSGDAVHACTAYGRAMTLDLALVVFDHVEGAERAYAAVQYSSREAPWVHELAFVEHHRHDRVVVRGTFAGRYVDLDE